MTTKHIKTAKTYLGQPEPSDAFTDAVIGIVWFAVKAVARSLWWALLFPMLSIPTGAAVAAWLLVGWPAAVAVVGVGLALLLGWRWASRPVSPAGSPTGYGNGCWPGCGTGVAGSR